MKSIPFGPISIFVRYLTLLLLISFGPANAEEQKNNEKQKKLYATINTSLGAIQLELYKNRAPKTVENFINYASTHFYDNTLFHRVIPGFMVQGGGFDVSFAKKPTLAPVKNEANAFIPNIRGTISMARTSDPHSATSQFFINVVDNASLNKNARSDGYAVFGKVVNGMHLADKISKVKTTSQNYMQNVPATPVIIESVVISGALSNAQVKASK